MEAVLNRAGFYLNDPARCAAERTNAAPLLDCVALTYGWAQAANMLRFARPSHPAAAPDRVIEVSAAATENGRFAPLNPSIVAVPAGYLVSVRLVNYRNRRAAYYQLEADNIIRSKNVIQAWDRSGGLIAEYPLVLPAPWASDEGRYQGLEDIRLMVHGGRLCFSASYAQLRPLPVPRLVFGETDLSADAPFPAAGSAVTVTALTECMASPAQQTEKNWMPVVHQDHLRWIYSVAPFRLLEWTGTGGANVQWVVFQGAPPATQLALESLRGSVGPVCVDGDWFSLVHFYSVGDGRWYHHRWLQHHPQTLQPIAASASFCFHPAADEAEVEFAAGLAVGHDGLLWVTYGRNDREARLAVIHPDAVRALTWYTTNTEPGNSP